jgi:hypothetical protein
LIRRRGYTILAGKKLRNRRRPVNTISISGTCARAAKIMSEIGRRIRNSGIIRITRSQQAPTLRNEIRGESDCVIGEVATRNPRRNSGTRSESPPVPPADECWIQNRPETEAEEVTRIRNQSGHPHRWVSRRVGSLHRKTTPRSPERNRRNVGWRRVKSFKKADAVWTADDVADNIRFQRTWLLSRFLHSQELVPA